MICVVGFTGFLHCNKLANLRCCNMIFHKSFVKLFIQSDKADVMVPEWFLQKLIRRIAL